MNSCTRREFLRYTLGAAAGAAFMPQIGCRASDTVHEGVIGVPEKGYPLVEASGSHRDIGRTIGAAMKEQILGLLDLSPDYAQSVAYANGNGRGTVRKMLDHTQAHFPQLIEELEGMAESLGVPFASLFAFNCRSEIDVLTSPPGCSTIALREEGRMILVHNEDGGDVNIGRMFLAKVTPPSGVSFLVYVYPGLLPGNGPGFNQFGIVQTTNYIQPLAVADGVPRYILARAVLESKSLDDALAIATMTPRAFSWHYNLASLVEGRVLSVETIAHPEPKHDILEVEGVYIHTNHLLHPGMTSADDTSPPPYDVPYISSTTRMDVLTEAVEKRGRPANVEEIMSLLSLHKGRPYSPCRHPKGDVRGSTLGTAVFQAPSIGMTLYHGNPCRGLKKEYVI
ncbi:MAG: C45 family peptidase [Candidatus Latescibacterota bacterium]